MSWRAWIAGGLFLGAACTGSITSTTRPWTSESSADTGAAGATAAGSGGSGGLGGDSGGPASGGGGAAPTDKTATDTSENTSSGPRETYYVQDGTLRDRCGERVVLRGVNHPTLDVDRQGKALAEIAKTGANAVRLFWYAARGVAITEAEAAISEAIKQHMLPILVMGDTTCEWETDKLDEIEAYWTSPEAVALIDRHKANLIINVADEPSAPNAPAFKLKYTSMLKAIRTAGIHVPVMIDGAECGREYGMLLSQGPALLQADPDHNLVFSAHLYNPMSASDLAKVYGDFAAAKLAFVVGAFGNKQRPGCSAALEYQALISEAQKQSVGWLAWSWGDDDPSKRWNSECGEFDMTSTFAFDSLEGWGKEVALSLPDSIMKTSNRPRSLATGECAP